jgi:multiple sugar transport system permease protein
MARRAADPWVIPPAMSTLAWLWLFDPSYSAFNWILTVSACQAFLARQPLLGTGRHHPGQRLGGSPFSLIMYLAALVIAGAAA